MGKAKETKYWLEAELVDGTKLEGTLTHHRMLNREKNTHRYSIDFGNLKESFTLAHPDMMIDLFIRKLYREQGKSAAFKEFHIIRPIATADLRRLLRRDHQEMKSKGYFGPAVKTVEDEWRVTLKMLEIGLMGGYSRIDDKEAQTIIQELIAEKKAK